VAMPRQSRTDITAVVERIREVRLNASAARSLLVAVTGIDGSGKRFAASRIVAELRSGGLQAGPINIDG
jgi:uridine kinase